MKDVYARLAKKLDSLPQGFPPTEDGVELAILRKVFSAEDAAMALKLRPIPETAAALARRLGRGEDELRRTLDAMAEKGQIGSFILHGRRVYALMPFVVGIYELQLHHLDRELAELCEAYMPTLATRLGGHPPGLARVVPVNRRIDSRATVLAYEDTRQMIERAHSFAVADCICRTEKALEGSPCTHPLETCLAFSTEEHAYEDGPTWGRTISEREALEILDAAEEEGLVHCTYNFQQDQMFVCNCCSCCCGFLRLLSEYETPYGLVRSNWVAVIDEDECAACGECADQRCPVAAIAEDADGACRVEPARCIGCGVCTVACATDAIRLEPRPEAERTTPPRTIVDWSVERTASRSPVKGLMLKGWLAWQQRRGAART